MAVEALLDLERAHVLAAGDDDVLAAVLDLDVVVGVPHREVAGAVPAARERRRARLRVLEVALHHRVAAQHHLAEGRAVARHRCARRRIADLQARERGHRHALPGHAPRALRQRQRGPVVLRCAQRGGAVGLGEAVEVRHPEAHRLHRLDDGRRRRRPTGRDVDPMLEAPPGCLGRVHEQVEDHRRAAEVRHPVLGDRAEDRRRLDAAQAHVRAAGGGDGPRVRPAVAVEHRQRPQIHRRRRQRECECVAQRVEVRAAVVIDDALGIARRARRVEQRQRVPLVARGPATRSAGRPRRAARRR